MTSKQKSSEKNTEAVKELTMVDSMWDTFENGVKQSRDMVDNVEETYLNTTEESYKYNQQYRQMVKEALEDAAETNLQFFKDFNMLQSKDDATVNSTYEKVNSFATYPQKLLFEFFNHTEKATRNNSKQVVSLVRETRKTWDSVTDQLIETTKQNSKSYFAETEGQFKSYLNKISI